MLDTLKILDANIDIPLGTGFEKQTVSNGDTPTSVTINIVENVSLTELFSKEYSYSTTNEITDNLLISEVFDVDFESSGYIKFNDSILVSDVFDKEYIYTVNKTIEDGLKVSETFDIYSSYDLNAVDNVEISENYSIDYSYNVKQTFEDSLNVSETFDIQSYLVYNWEDNLVIENIFTQNTKLYFKVEDKIIVTEQFSLIESSPTGDLVFTNTVKNKYIDEPFIDSYVHENKSYKYVVKTYNDFNVYSGNEEYSVTVQNAGDITPPAAATLTVNYNDGYLFVYCQDPSDSDWSSTTVRYDIGSQVTNKNSGTKLYTSKSKNQYATSPFKLEAIAGKTYFFKSFTTDIYGNTNEEQKNIAITTYIAGGSIPTAPITNLKVVLSDDNKYGLITYTDPEDVDWEATYIVVKEDSIPENVTDGQYYASLKRNAYQKNPLKIPLQNEDTTYYIKAFPRNKYNIFNTDSASVSITTLDITPPSNINKFDVDYSHYEVRIVVENNNSDVKGVKVIRFEDQESDITKGIELVDIVDLSGSYEFIDTTILYNKNYIYKCYPYDSFNNINNNDKSVTIFTKDERVSNISDLTVEIIGEDVVFTYTNPSNNYFLESNLYVSGEKIYKNKSQLSLNTSNTKGYVKKSIKISDLPDHSRYGNKYYFLVVAKNYKGEEIFTPEYNVYTEIKDTVPPSDIQNLSVYIENGYANITWDESLSNDWSYSTVVVKENEEPEHINDGEAVERVYIKNKYQSIPLTYQLTKQDVKYYFKVFPVDDNGNINETCIPVSCKLDVPAFNDGVTDLNLVNKDGVVIITCKDPDDERWSATKVVRSEYGFPLSPDDGEIVFVNYIKDQYVTNGYEDKGLEPRKTYYYSAFCRDKNEIYSTQIDKKEIFLLQNSTLTAVNNLSIEVIENALELSWEDSNSNDWEGCKLIRKTGSEPNNHADGQVLIDNNIRNRFQTAGFVDTQIDEADTYYYCVFAYDKYGNYIKGNVVEYTVNDTTPTAPATLLEVKQSPNANDIIIKLSMQDPSDTDWCKTVVYYDDNINFTNKKELFTNTVKNKYANDYAEIVNNDLVQSSTYYFCAYAYDLAGNQSDVSNTLTFNIFEKVNVGISEITNLKYADSKITFNIDDDETKDFTKCVIVRKIGSAPKNAQDRDKVVVQYSTPDQYKTAFVTDTGLSDFTTYYYKAFPYKASSNGSFIYNDNCPAVSITTQVTRPPVTVPLTAKLANGAIQLNWTLPEDSTFAECYIVKKVGSMPTSENDGELIVHNTNGYRITNYVDKNITNNTTYYYRSFTLDKYGNWNRTYAGTSVKVSYLTPTGSITNLKIGQKWSTNSSGYITLGTKGADTDLYCSGMGVDGDGFSKVELYAKRDGIPSAKDGYLIARNTSKNAFNCILNENNLSGISFYSKYENINWYFKTISYDKLGNQYEGNVYQYTAYSTSNTAYEDKYSRALYEFRIGESEIELIDEDLLSTPSTKLSNCSLQYDPVNINSEWPIPTINVRYNYYDYLEVLEGKANSNTTFIAAQIDSPVVISEARKTYNPSETSLQPCKLTLPELSASNISDAAKVEALRKCLNIITVSAAFSDTQYNPTSFEFLLATIPFTRKTNYYPNMFKVDGPSDGDYDYVVLINAELPSYDYGVLDYDTYIVCNNTRIPTSINDGTRLYHPDYPYSDGDKKYYDKDATTNLRSFIQNRTSTKFLNPCTVLKIPKADYANGLYIKAFFVKTNSPYPGTYSNSYGVVILK